MEGVQPVSCVRCNVPLVSDGWRSFQVWSDEHPFLSLEMLRLEYYVCPTCGHVEFFAPGVGDRSANPRLPASAPLSEAIPPMSPAVAVEGGGMEETWMCSCGECNFVRYDKCLGCGRPRAV